MKNLTEYPVILAFKSVSTPSNILLAFNISLYGRKIQASKVFYEFESMETFIGTK